MERPCRPLVGRVVSRSDSSDVRDCDTGQVQLEHDVDVLLSDSTGSFYRGRHTPGAKADTNVAERESYVCV
jgi:hypothetical protein